MRELIKNIRLYFIEHNIPILFNICLFVGAILLLKGIGFLIEVNGNSNVQENTTSIIEQKDKLEYENIQKDYKKQINIFISNCNKKDTEQAYSMLASSTKDEKYKNVDEFNREFIEKYFDRSVDTEIETTDVITNFKIKILEDELTSGKISGRSAEAIINCGISKEEKSYKIIINSIE